MKTRLFGGLLAAIVTGLGIGILPVYSADIIWVTENTDGANDPSPDDSGWTDLLTAAGHTVERMQILTLDTDDSALGDLEAADLVIVSRDTNSGSYANNPTEIGRWNGISTPLIQMSSFLVRSNRWLWFNNTENPVALDIGMVPEVPDHPIFFGLSTNEFGEIEIVETDIDGFVIENLNLTGATDAGNGTLLASEFSSGRVWIALWEAGTEFYAGSGQVPGGQRMWFAGGGSTANPKGVENFNATGEQLLLNAVDFLVQNQQNDQDGDGMPDVWEDQNGLNKLVDDADLDRDQDGLDNGEEFAAGTDPQDDDTDDDGLKDGVETGGGVYGGANDTGTDPLDPDADDDGLLDGAETNTNVFVNAENTGTNPFDEDTDLDRFRDGAEVNLHGTSPLDGGDAPELKDVMFVGGGENPGNGDVRAVRLVEDVFGIESVSYAQASATSTGDELGFDLLILSSTPSSGNIRSKFQISPVPIINWEEAITDSGSGEFGMSFVTMSKSATATQIRLLPGHPISNGLPAQITLFDAPGPETTMTVDPVTGLTVVGTGVDGTLSTAGGGTVGDPVDGTAMLIVADAGDSLNEVAFSLGEEIAPARRVALPFTDATVTALTPDGVTLFYNTLLWATSGAPAGNSLRFTAISYQDDPLNPEITLTWTSEPGKEYRLLSTRQLSADRTLWTVEIETVPAAAGETTTRQVEADKLLDPRRFYVVEER